MKFAGATHRDGYVRSRRAGERVMESVKRSITTRLKLKVNEQKSAALGGSFRVSVSRRTGNQNGDLRRKQ